MTTATLDPAIGQDEDLESWLNHEIEKPCSARQNGRDCHLSAAWLFYGKFTCSCERPSTNAFVCTPHKEFLTAVKHKTWCSKCLAEAEIVYVERIR